MRVIAAWSVVVVMAGLAMGSEPAASVDDLAWLAGRWHGEAFGGTFEETWNPPAGGAMVGMFKLLRDGEIEMYELMRIAPTGESIVLEVKHFSADFVAWEEKDGAVRFPLVEAGDGVARFKGLGFERDDDGTVHVSLDMRSPETGEVRTVHYTMQPAG